MTQAVIGIAPANAHSDSLPLGDGHVSTKKSSKGSVFACHAGNPNAGGAQSNVPWIHGSKWNPAEKPAVSGQVEWPNASFTETTTSTYRRLVTAGVPVGSTTGTFPIADTDPVYAFDHNPNSIKSSATTVKIPAKPKVAAHVSCLPSGSIGMMTNGVALFNALDGPGRDAEAHEVQDSCSGHPERNGTYHYHSGSACLLSNATGRSTLIGYANDGFGIYVERKANGKLLTNTSLDKCHGRTSRISWDGKKVKKYHYVVTAEYPYTLGCFRGTATTTGNSSPAGAPSGNGGGLPPPPFRTIA